MKNIILVKPTLEDEKAANEFKEEFFSRNETIINGSALLDQMEYSAWLHNLQINSSPATARKDWVVASTFFAKSEDTHKIIGIIDIRHSLEQPFLINYGGHIGYAVRPSERRKGYATQMLNKALEYVKNIGISSVMLGCYSDNEASRKTILKCGGRLTETKNYVDGKPMQIYWIDK